MTKASTRQHPGTPPQGPRTGQRRSSVGELREVPATDQAIRQGGAA